MSEQTNQFVKSWWQWRNSLPEGQRWMADALAWSATHGGDVEGYNQSQWSLDEVASWLREQDGNSWQKWSSGWKNERWS